MPLTQQAMENQKWAKSDHSKIQMTFCNPSTFLHACKVFDTAYSQGTILCGLQKTILSARPRNWISSTKAVLPLNIQIKTTQQLH